MGGPDQGVARGIHRLQEQYRRAVGCAFGAIRAIHEAGLHVPDDISVVGFDDIESAAYHLPALTTVRQPLQEMGEIAARTLLNRIEHREPYVPEIAIEPEFIVRNSTGNARRTAKEAALKLA